MDSELEANKIVFTMFAIIQWTSDKRHIKRTSIPMKDLIYHNL